jgi:hypothetical protein
MEYTFTLVLFQEQAGENASLLISVSSEYEL